MRAAQIQAEQMASTEKLAHELPDGRYPNPASRLRVVGYEWSLSAENLAAGQRMTPESAVTGWLASKGHRANMLNPQFLEMGAGYAVDKKGRRYYVQVFGRPSE
jgi:uncharacterized protein YkwD